MRIMHFAGGGDIGGAKTHILSLGQELAQANQFHLVSFRRGKFVDEAIELGLDVTVADYTWNLSAGIKKTLAAIDAFEPDIIHCHGAKANVMGIIIKKLRGTPVCTTVHSEPSSDYMGAPLKQLVYGSINNWALKRMDYYMAVAGQMENNLINRGFDPQRIYVIHNGLDFTNAVGKFKIKNANDEIVVGIAARLNPIKNISLLLKSFAIASARNPRLRLKIAGIGEEENALKNLAEQLNIGEKTEFVGWVDDMPAFFAGIDINVLSSLSETFPYSLLEGAYEHCAAIASDVGGIGELIEHNQTGYLFDSGDEQAFAEYIYQLSVDEHLRQRLADNLFDRVSNLFSIAKMGQVQQTAYNKMMYLSHYGERHGAVICGAYGRGNAGDEAILHAIIKQMKIIDEDMPLTVLSRNKLNTKLKNKTNSIYTFNVLSFLRHLRKSKIFINGGGSLIQDITSSRSLYFYLFTLWAARISGCKVIMYGCGIGPIKYAINKRIAARVLDTNADIITLRDSKSMDELSEMAVIRPQIRVSADPTVNLSKSSDEEVAKAWQAEGVPSDIPKVCFCLRNWPDFTNLDAIAKAADYAYDKYGLQPVFIPIEIPKDISIAKDIAARMNAPYYLCEKSHLVEDLIGMLGSCKLVLGMRLHSLIFATAAETAVIGISYDIKINSFMRDIGSDAYIPLKQLTAEKLCKQIDMIAYDEFRTSYDALKRLRMGEVINSVAVLELLKPNN